ncbi:MAG: glycosyltransferase family 4 protein [Pirellulales bacterium]|nr:glycosyltransferase family 4 protein [Pirellulales bacterium]
MNASISRPAVRQRRIGLVLDRFDPRRGGVEQWTYQYVRFLLAAGHEVHALARDFAPAIAASGCHVHRLEAPRSRLALAAEAERQLRRLRLDVVHDTGTGWYCDVFQPHGGSRRASFEQNLLLTAPWQRSLKRAAAAWLPRYREFRALAARQLADDGRLVLALSRRVADDLMRYDGVTPERIRIVYNGVDTARFSPSHRERHRQLVRARLEIGPEEVVLLIVAHNFRLKGVPTLLAAAMSARRAGRPARVVVVGGKAPRTGNTDGITFVGPVDDCVPYYAAADIYVQPTYYDPCSLVVLEALASGLPVITSRFNGAGELLVRGREGDLLDDPGSPEELLQALEPLWDAGNRARYGQAARALACEHTLRRNCQEILAVYDELPGGTRQAA